MDQKPARRVDPLSEDFEIADDSETDGRHQIHRRVHQARPSEMDADGMYQVDGAPTRGGREEHISATDEGLGDTRAHVCQRILPCGWGRGRRGFPLLQGLGGLGFLGFLGSLVFGARALSFGVWVSVSATGGRGACRDDTPEHTQ